MMRTLNRANMARRTARLRSMATHPTSTLGQCKREVRECYGVASDGSPDAATSWASSPTQHHETDPAKIPAGAPVFWLGGSAGHGHVAIATGYGNVWSTDIRRAGYFDRVPLAEISRTWPALRLVGWSEHIDGVRVIDRGQR